MALVNTNITTDNDHEIENQDSRSTSSLTESESNASMSSRSDSLTSSSDGNSLNSKNNECLRDLPSNSAVHVQREMNGTALANSQPHVFGDVSIKGSRSVHIGGKTVYKGPVTINQYLYNNSTSVSGPEINFKSNDDNKDNCDNVKSRNRETLDDEIKRSRSLLHSINPCFCDKDWLQKRRSIIITCLVILFLVSITVHYIWLSESSNPSESSIIAAPYPPTGPVNITQLSDDTVSITWGLPESDGGRPIEAYKIESKDVIEKKWQEVGLVNASSHYMLIDNLKMDHAYNFRIYAKNKIGLSEALESHPSYYIESIKHPLEIESRKEWEASTPKRPPVDLQISPAPYVIICHTFYWYCNTKDTCGYCLRKLQKSAFKLDYGDIEYNFLVGADGRVYEGRGWDVEGNHTDTFDNRSIGIGFIGNYSTFHPTEGQLNVTKKLLNFGVNRRKITDDYKLLGQKQIMNTTSPGNYLYETIRSWDHWSAEP